MRWVLWTLSALVGCEAGSSSLVPPTDDTEDTVVDEGVTYHKDVRPIFQRQCETCHTPGGAGPFSMTYDEAEWADGPPSWLPAALAAIEAGTMPPWKPADDCVPIEGERRLSVEERQVLADWATAGFTEGSTGAYVDPSAGVAAVREADMTLQMLTPFVPSRESPDDYRCFILDYPADDVERWMAGFHVVPDQAAMVHHVLLYQLGPDWAEQLEAWDAEDETPGYSCLFDPGTWDSLVLAGWAPGQPPQLYPEGVARRLVPGSKLVFQVHYNTQNIPQGEEPPADQSAVELWMLPEGPEPRQELISIPFPVTRLHLPAGDPDVTVEDTIDLRDYIGDIPDAFLQLFASQVKLVGAFPHMHNLGTSIRADFVGDNGDDRCLINIPEWDFGWQQSYLFQPDAWVEPDLTRKVRVRCTYDNSAENQPVYNGVQLEPRDVRWGEGTTDEMCLVFFETLLPTGLIDGGFEDYF